jgi:hypothetical protein
MGTWVKLRGGDRRATGRSDEVAADVLDDPGLFHGVLSDDSTYPS